MGVTAETLRLLVEAGLTGEQLVAIAESMERAPTKPSRTKAAERQARYEERKRQKTVSPDVRNDASEMTSGIPPFPPLSPEPPITTLTPPSPPIVPPTPVLAPIAEQIWLLQPVVGGKRRSTRPDVAKALKAAVDSRGGDPVRIEAACRAYYRLPDCRKDGGQFARGAAVLLAEDRWREFEPGPAQRPAAHAVTVTPEIHAKRVQHFRDTGEWRQAWGEFPEDLASATHRKALEIAK